MAEETKGMTLAQAGGETEAAKTAAASDDQPVLQAN
jgi:hypothetical protein